MLSHQHFNLQPCHRLVEYDQLYADRPVKTVAKLGKPPGQACNKSSVNPDNKKKTSDLQHKKRNKQ